MLESHFIREEHEQEDRIYIRHARCVVQLSGCIAVTRPAGYNIEETTGIDSICSPVEKGKISMNVQKLYYDTLGVNNEKQTL